MLKGNVIGRFVKEPEANYTKTGKKICHFDIACPSSYDREKTNFIRCIAFGNMAEAIVKYCEKGQKVYANGNLEISINEYNGKKYTNVELYVDDLEFLEKAKEKKQ